MTGMEFRIPKSNVSAKTIYDFKRLEQKHYLLLPCEVQEEQEAICMCFHLKGFRPLTELKEEEEAVKLPCLWQIAELEELYQRLDFSLEPGNLYCDISGRVRVKIRDIIPAVYKDRERQFLKQYKALIVYMMEKSTHSYEDYLSAGSEMMGGQSEITGLWDEMSQGIKVFLEAKTVPEMKELLEESYNQVREKEKKNMIRIERKKYERMRKSRIVSTVLLVIYTAAVFYSLIWYQP